MPLVRAIYERHLALIPARAGSKSIPRKNFTLLVGQCPAGRAVCCALAAGCHTVVLSSDDPLYAGNAREFGWGRCDALLRPPALAQDDTPMIDVVTHALEQMPGPEDQIILLVQPTQPLRQPKHLQAAIALLQETQADSVVSVVDVGVRDAVLYVREVRAALSGETYQYLAPLAAWVGGWSEVPRRRQGEPRAYQCDGTVYAFWRRTVTKYGTIYGKDVRPLIIPPEETCALDDPRDWAEAERRLRERDGG